MTMTVTNSNALLALKCAAVLVALSATAPTGAQALSCNACSATNRRTLQDLSIGHNLGLDIFFNSHLWNEHPHPHPHRHGRSGHGQGRGHGRRDHKPANAEHTQAPATHAASPSPAPATSPSATDTSSTSTTEAPAAASTATSTDQYHHQHPLFYLTDYLEQLVEQLPAASPKKTTAPAFEVEEHTDSYKLLVDVPGVIEDTITIDISPSEVSDVRVMSLTASASQQRRSGEGADTKEITYTRSWELANDVGDSDSISAALDDDSGILVIVAPKRAPPLPTVVQVTTRHAESTHSSSESSVYGTVEDEKTSSSSGIADANNAVAETTAVMDKAVQASPSSRDGPGGQDVGGRSWPSLEELKLEQAKVEELKLKQKVVENKQKVLEELKQKMQGARVADATAATATTDPKPSKDVADADSSTTATPNTDVVGKNNLQFAVDVEEPSPAELQADAAAELEAEADAADVEFLDDPAVVTARAAYEAAVAAARSASHPGQPL